MLFSFPRAGVGMQLRRASVAKNGTLARPKLVPTPARGNQKTAWEPEKCFDNYQLNKEVYTNGCNDIVG